MEEEGGREGGREGLRGGRVRRMEGKEERMKGGKILAAVLEISMAAH